MFKVGFDRRGGSLHLEEIKQVLRLCVYIYIFVARAEILASQETEVGQPLRSAYNFVVAVCLFVCD
jgi:hypothetical protein